MNGLKNTYTCSSTLLYIVYLGQNTIKLGYNKYILPKIVNYK